jgi:hypothetical protein
MTVAVREGDMISVGSLSGQVTVPTAQPLTLGPKMTSVGMKLEKKEGLDGFIRGFALWQGSADIEQPTGAVSVRLVGAGETLDTLLLDGGVAGW